MLTRLVLRGIIVTTLLRPLPEHAIGTVNSSIEMEELQVPPKPVPRTSLSSCKGEPHSLILGKPKHAAREYLVQKTICPVPHGVESP